MKKRQAYQEAVKRVDFESFGIYNVAYRIDKRETEDMPDIVIEQS